MVKKIILLMPLMILAIAVSYFRYIDSRVNVIEVKTKDGISYQYQAGSLAITGYSGISEELVIPADVNGRPVIRIHYVKFYNPLVSSIRLSEGIKEIEDFSFASNENIERIYLPESLWSIGDRTFQDYKNMEYISFSEGLIEIGYSAFEGCSSLKEVIFPKTLERVQNKAFFACDSLEQVVFQDSIRYIGDESFANNENLKTVEFKNTVGTVGSAAFAYCPELSTVQLPDHALEVSDSAFRMTPWMEEESKKGPFLLFSDNLMKYTGDEETIVIPDEARHISRSFADGKHLKDVTLSPFAEKPSVRDLEEQQERLVIRVPKEVNMMDIAGAETCTKLEIIEFQGINTNINLWNQWGELKFEQKYNK